MNTGLGEEYLAIPAQMLERLSLTHLVFRSPFLRGQYLCLLIINRDTKTNSIDDLGDGSIIFVHGADELMKLLTLLFPLSIISV